MCPSGSSRPQSPPPASLAPCFSVQTEKEKVGIPSNTASAVARGPNSLQRLFLWNWYRYRKQKVEAEGFSAPPQERTTPATAGSTARRTSTRPRNRGGPAPPRRAVAPSARVSVQIPLGAPRAVTAPRRPVPTASASRQPFVASPCRRPWRRALAAPSPR